MTAADLKRLPENIEAEQALLGAVLLNNEALTAIRETRLDADHFYDPVHARIFEAMCSLVDEARPVTPSGLAPAFNGVDIQDGLTVNAYIAKLMAGGISVSGAKGFAQEVIAGAARRELAEIFGEGIEALEQNTRGSVIIDQTADRLQLVREAYARTGSTRISLGNAASDALDQARERQTSGREIGGISTGLRDLDRATGGWQKREMTVIGGRPSMGKTAIATSLLLNAAQAGHGVLFFSLEMDAMRLAERCLTDLAWSHTAPIEYTNIRNGALSEFDLERLGRAQQHLEQLPFIIEHAPALSTMQISAIARRVRTHMERSGYALEIVCVDHMDKVKASGYWRGNAVQEAGEKSGDLFAMAKELDVAMVALKQLSRGPEARDDKRPNLSDLRMSGDVEQDADTIIFPFREAYYLERQSFKKEGEEADRIAALEACRNVLELSIAKSRSGPTRTIKVFCDIAASAVRDMENHR
jgi:replicative DNA helicase